MRPPFTPFGAAAHAAPQEQPESTTTDPPEVHLAWELTRCAVGLSPEAEADVRAAILAVLLCARRGDTRVELYPNPSTLTGAQCELLATIAGDGPLRTIIGRNGDFKPFIVSDNAIGTHRLFSAEQAIRTFVESRVRFGGEILQHREVSTPAHFTPEQAMALAAALSEPMTLITGGPGTGKTTIVAAILEALLEAGLRHEEIVLAAPTGKAAHRLSEGLKGRARAATIHRVLGFSPSRRAFAASALSPLDARAVIVDEAAMIGSEMMRSLLDATRPDARIVLLGDAFQLPAIAPGAPFRDLLRILPRRAVSRLSFSQRTKESDMSGRSVLSFAASIREGANAFAEQTTRGPDALVFAGVEVIHSRLRDVERSVLASWVRHRGGDTRASRDAASVEIHAGRVRETDVPLLERLWQRAHGGRILCVTREPPHATSSSVVNETVCEIAVALGHRAQGAFAAGDPVLFGRNDYTRELWNGDEGIIVGGGARNSGLCAVFRKAGEFVGMELGAVRNDIDLAYATTVHRAQGGEFDDVLLVLPERDTEIATRELIYTAVTRARKSVVVVGEPEQFARAVARGAERSTWLGRVPQLE